MRYCKKCVMPDTRPGMQFDENGVCYPCVNHERKKLIDWNKRWQEFEELRDRYVGSNGSYYDCINTISGGKDSHFQASILKEAGFNPLCVSVDNVSWTDTGRKNLENFRKEV